MLTSKALAQIICPVCQGTDLQGEVLVGSPDAIEAAVIHCAGCMNWYPCEDGILDLLVGALAYQEDRADFRRRHSDVLARLGLADAEPTSHIDVSLQELQKSHFDWYADNEKQTYLQFEEMPFWRAVDVITFGAWRAEARPGNWLVDVGCGPARATSRFFDLDLAIIGFDVSKAQVLEAERRHRASNARAQASFLVADATSFPLRSDFADIVVVYGVLHHVPDPRRTCSEIGRVLRPGGVYLGSENNVSAFRKLFDFLQRLRPLWHEEAGPEALISYELVQEGLATSEVQVERRTSVFVPPHLVNLLPRSWGPPLLKASDAAGRAVPWLANNGGLIIFRGRKATGTGRIPIHPG